ncbi:MAG: single-stranded DNA-binding protein [Acidobacteriia bacterium]|nr:single-stranded DNA-binding protein [Terriglobia bacterium]
MQKNRIEVCGWLAAQPAQRHLPSGTAVATVRLGETYSYLSQGKAEQHTNWHALSFYGDLAHLAITFKKGDHLFVEGTMEQRKFIPADGSKRMIWELIVHSCHLIGDPRPRTTSLSDPLEKVAASDEANAADWPVG